MGKVIYAYLASLDGYVADERGVFDWAQPDEEVLDHINHLESSVGTYLYGRTVYDMMRGWETDPAYAAQSPRSAEFAQMWTAASKVVFSRTLDTVDTKRTRLEREFTRDKVEQVRASTDADLTVSGATLAAEAWRLGLIDEVQLYVAPVLVGGGLRMFPAGVHAQLELVDERGFSNGMVFSRYAVIHEKA